MVSAEWDWLARQAAFYYLDELVAEYGQALPWEPLRDGFDFEGERVTLVGVRGIWKPQCLDLPISIRTSPANPYGDTTGADGLLRYRYFQDDPSHPDNVGLRECFTRGVPLIYFDGLERGWYAPLWPLILVQDDPVTLTVVGACDDLNELQLGVSGGADVGARRRYATRLAVVRLHQARFRQDVLRAYARSCSVCRLGHLELLDAAHIIADHSEGGGQPVVPNGLALCKIHHAAFDANLIGVRPDCVVEVQPDVLREADGPMLKHGLQAIHHQRIHVPHRSSDRPDPDRLEIRYTEFRQAS
jgi:putative restriction endonuclease